MDNRAANYFTLIVLAAFGGIVAAFLIKGVGVPPLSVVGVVMAICLLLAIGKVVIGLFTVRRR